MSLKRRLGEGDEVPSIAGAAFTVTRSTSGEASRAAPTQSGYSGEAQQHSVAQEAEPEPTTTPNPCELFLNRFRAALEEVHAGTAAALKKAEGGMQQVVAETEECIMYGWTMTHDAELANKEAHELLLQKKDEVQSALKLLMGELA